MVCRCCGKEFKPVKPRHAIICGDSRDPGVLASLLGDIRVNVAITSPPYAAQREYDKSSGFSPILPAHYGEWFRPVAASIAAALAPDGSFFLNIKPHAEDGERSLYVMDLVIAHKRQWGWRFVDELCWRNTRNGVPGGWPNRFKSAFKIVYHFSKSAAIKFNPESVSTPSDDVFEYSADNPKSESGSGLLGSGKRQNQHSGLARHSNVIEVPAESGQGEHSAPFPRALVEFFIKAFSDVGDVVLDVFMGSGTTSAAAHVLGRNSYGCELSPAYCDVIIGRMEKLGCTSIRLAGDGRTFREIAAERKQVPA